MNARALANHEKAALIKGLRAEAKRLEAKRAKLWQAEDKFLDKNSDGLLGFSFPDLNMPVGWDQRFEDGELSSVEVAYLESLPSARSARHAALTQEVGARTEATETASQLEQLSVRRHNKVFDYLEFAIKRVRHSLRIAIQPLLSITIKCCSLNKIFASPPLEQRPSVQPNSPNTSV